MVLHADIHSTELRHTVSEIKGSYRTGKPSPIEAEGAKLREVSDGITRMEVDGKEERAETIEDLKSECEKAKRIIA